MEGEKTLCVLGRFESAHLPFPLARRRMRGFDAIVGVPLPPVSHVPEDDSHGSGIASQFVSNDLQGIVNLRTKPETLMP